MYKRILLLGFVLTSSLFLSGCVGDLQELICGFLPDSDHCYQGASVQEADPYGCEKIKGEKFKDGGSNPPRDKCYLQIAENTGDLEACKKIKGGLMSYTQSECILSSSILNENPSGCKMLTGADKSRCVSELGGKITSYRVLEVDDQIQIVKDQLAKGDDPELTKQLQGLEGKRKDMLDVMTKNNKDEYTKMSDPMNREIVGDFAVGDIDSATKNKLLSFNESLKKQGLAMSADQYEKIKDYYKFLNDPANDIENMDDSKIVKDRFGEKVGNVVDKLKFWKTNDTDTEKKLDEQLRFYERMLERQSAINKGLSERAGEFDQTIEDIAEKVKDKVVDEVKDKIIEDLFGEATGLTTKITTAVLGEAIDTVKAEAKSAEFRGLVKAYDDGMAEELGRFGGNVEKAHAEVVKKLSTDPYTYAEGDSFAKYGNLIENKDCDGSNPHCISRDVFWKSMKKSYNYQNK